MSTLSTLARVSLTVLFAGAAVGAHAQTQAQPSAAPQAQTHAAKDAPGKSDTAAVASAFKRADANGDGKVTSEEASQYPALAARFAEFDKNADGALSTDEFSAGASSGK
jgi:Ca2+-binding EF-hand superfamily protein